MILTIQMSELIFQSGDSTDSYGEDTCLQHLQRSQYILQVECGSGLEGTEQVLVSEMLLLQEIETEVVAGGQLEVVGR